MSFLPRARTSSIPKHLVPQWESFCLGLVLSYRALMRRIIKLHPNGAFDGTGIVAKVIVAQDGKCKRVTFQPAGSEYPWFLTINEEVADNGTIHFDVLSVNMVLPPEWHTIPVDAVARVDQREARENMELDCNASMYMSAFKPYDEWRGCRQHCPNGSTLRR